MDNAVLADYRPVWWLPGANLQTLWAARGCRIPAPAHRRERLELPDGDFVDLAWVGGETGPLLIVLHGLEGSIDSPYIRRLLYALLRWKCGACVLHFRGCSGTPNRLARSYHSGDTADFKFLLDTLRVRYPQRPVGAVGYSLGGNVLLKTLGEQGPASKLFAAAAISVPFDLAAAASRLDQGFSKLYQRHLVRSMRNKLRRKFARIKPPINLDQLDQWRTFWQYDEQVTAPLHGFENARDYYTRSSCQGYLSRITRPTLIVHARDDPFLPASAIPRHDALAPSITLEVVATGGHVGFVSRRRKTHGAWLEGRLLAYLAENLPHAVPSSG